MTSYTTAADELARRGFDRIMARAERVIQSHRPIASQLADRAATLMCQFRTAADTARCFANGIDWLGLSDARVAHRYALERLDDGQNPEGMAQHTASSAMLRYWELRQRDANDRAEIMATLSDYYRRARDTRLEELGCLREAHLALTGKESGGISPADNDAARRELRLVGLEGLDIEKVLA